MKTKTQEKAYLPTLEELRTQAYEQKILRWEQGRKAIINSIKRRNGWYGDGHGIVCCNERDLSPSFAVELKIKGYQLEITNVRKIIIRW